MRDPTCDGAQLDTDNQYEAVEKGKDRTEAALGAGALRARYRVVTELLDRGSPCPGCLGQITDRDGNFHHALLREGHAVTEAQKILLYDARNGTLAHHGCHVPENPHFRRNCAIIITSREGGPEAIRAYLEELRLWFRILDVPSDWQEVWDRWDDESRWRCPVCGQRKVHIYLTGDVWGGALSGQGLLCWGCLWMSQ